MDDETFGKVVISLIAGMIIGGLAGVAIPEIGHAVVNIDSLDDACKVITGNESAVFLDLFGSNQEFICVYDTKLVQIKPEPVEEYAGCPFEEVIHDVYDDEGNLGAVIRFGCW